MKTRSSVILCVALTVGAWSAATAHVAPSQPPLPNLDARQSFTNATASVRAQTAAASVAALSDRVGGVQYQADAPTGGARYLAAQRGFLTGVGGVGKGLSAAALNAVPANDPYRVVKAFVNEQAAVFGHDAAQLNAAQVKMDAVTAHSGMRTIIWQQRVDDIPVYGALFVSHLTKNDELISVSSRLVTDLSRSASLVPNRAALVSHPVVSAATATRLAAVNLGETNAAIALETLESPNGAEQKQSFRSARLNGETYAQLVWLPLQNESLQLCWQVILTSRARPEMYLTLISAQTGDVLLRRCLTAYATPATYNVFTSDSPSPFSPGSSAPSSYQPPGVARTLVTITALNTNASPNGWINDGGNETVGNNVDAHLDRNDDNLPDLPRPQGNPARTFDFPLDLTQGPGTYGDAAVVNLFYWNNFVHDKMYEFGFTEVFGNFQTDNFGRGGEERDAVQADSQDGGGFNNANFSTPPDGRPGRMQMYIFDGPNPDRDGSLDAEVMVHEYGHGVSNRLLGGGVGISELQTAGMGEGWSDFIALSLLSEPTDDPHGNYASGGYASYQLGSGYDQNYYFGIRRYPYTTDLARNPLTFKDIDPAQADLHSGVPVNPVMPNLPLYASEVHNQGEVWCVTLWDARANLIDKLGTVEGNKLMLQLVIDGLKLAPANATFIEARDGILMADRVLTGGDNLAELWYAFAKRGMGFSAKAPRANTTSGVQEAFDVPDDIVSGPEDGILEVRVTPTTGTALLGNTTNRIFVRVMDGKAVTNATVTATVSSGGTLTFRNDGVDPDLTANDANYTADFLTPSSGSNVTLTVFITAPDKDPATNVVVYSIVPLPPNDFFANATKVPAAGSNYVTLNEAATLETGEPVHAGVTSGVASLWWTYTPAVNGPVLVDTGGSQADTIVAVYTNNTLSTLKPVVSANDIGNRKQAFVFFDGKAGVAYRIAVASYDKNSTGTIRLAITPNGIPDTNAPSVTVTAPLSGLTVTTNRVTVMGTAIDPDPNPSGLQQVNIRVNQVGLAPEAGVGQSANSIASLISTNWSETVGLYEGLNEINVSVKDVAGNQSASVVLNVTYRPLNPPNDFFVNAIALSGVAGTNAVNTLKATKEINEPVHAGNAGGKSAWWTYQPPADGQLVLSTTNSTFDTLLALYTGNSLGSLKLIADNDDASDASGGASTLVAAVRSNQVYRIAVDGYDAAGGTVFLQYFFTPGAVYRLTVATNIGGTVTPASMDVLAGSTVQVTAQPTSGYTFDHWSGDIVSLANPISVVMTGNRSVAAQFLATPYTDGFESGDFAGLGWTTGGNLPWVVQSTNTASGSFAARSGAIGASQSSSLFLTRNFRAGLGTFALRVSSEPTWDVFAFYLDGVLQRQWSGEQDWTSFGFPLTAGTHTLEWRYSKDANNNAGLDAAFIDNVNLPILVPVNATTPAHLTARRQTDGLVYLDILGQTNQLYNIQVSSNLVSWQPLTSLVTANGFGHVLDPGSLTNKVRFYRAVTPAP